MPIDLDTIQLHLDNFVTTWKSWDAIFENLPKALTFFGELSSDDNAFTELSSDLEGSSETTTTTPPATPAA